MSRAATLTALLLGSGLLLAACGDDEPREAVDLGGEGDEARAIEIRLGQPPAEGGESDPFAPPVPEMRDVIRHLQAVADRDHVKGVFLRAGPFAGAWGRAADLVDALQQVRDEGKPVHCHFELADNVAYMAIAQSCDRISMTPAGHLELVGPAAHMFFARSLLEKIGLEAEIVQAGEYKGAAEPLTRDDISPAAREAMGAILDDLHALLVEGIAEGRDVSKARAGELLDGGPYGAGGAREAGLVDDVGFDDEAREHLRKASGVDEVRRVSLIPEPEPMGLGDLLGALAGDEPEEEPEGERVALVLLEGTIVDAHREGMESARSGPFVRALRDFADDDSVKAVVLRIDSPGGSALASDRMWHAVRRAAKRKPVIVSVGDMAASGGYYIASAADEILAHEGSLVGSIGVVGGKVQMTDLADRIGVNVVVMQRGRHAAWASPARAFTDEERQILTNMLWRTYSRFIRRVEQGRDMPQQKVRQAAQGRLFTGRGALDRGLVDEVGGLGDALQRAREQGDLPEDAPVERWPRDKSLLDALAGRFGAGDSHARALMAELGGEATAPLGQALWLPSLLSDGERVALTLPYVLRIE